ncbi:hypothetical protein FN846DRAFT_951649 [Sphaerosporella brunnea]|uniref:Uncharacterized protein n=1 Tax=Sphaerosporella brunnea TaxID=1250544 RepID=A0A5J5EV66_9PEZI|nr:hypothetical protein FN846DRAFT_951610 [Sphaerosporella brunnea]KAA8905005.1 hypothetical protein FN846DRAFT_951649 [Sphaerosporella brunnea]
MKASRRDAFKADPSHDNSEDKQYRRDYPVPGSAGFRNDTPLSWFNTDPSVEDLSKEISQFPSKPEVSTFPESRPQETFVETPSVATGASDSPAVREKTSSWASFIQRATAPRMRKEQRLHGAPVTSPALASPPGGESEHCAITQDNNISDAFLDVDHLRHREGQTPGRHISNEIALAMAAVATGRIQDQSFRGHEFNDELRGSILPPEAYDFQNVSQLSLKSCSAAHGVGLRGGASASKSYSPTTFPDRKDSPTIAPHNTRPPSAQRYSPTFHRLSSGAASPDNKPRSQMSTSLASIDSEGSWLSGKIVTRQSVHQLSPLRTSDDDDYFTGLDHHSRDVGGGSDGCGARSDLDDMAEDKSAASEDECNMWREGPGKRIQLEGPTRAISRPGILNSFDEPRPFQFPQHDTATIPNQISPEFGTPLQLSVQLTESYHAR